MKKPEEIEAELEQTRAELADTVDALAEKFDVPGRAREKADEWRDTATGIAGEVRVGAEDRPGAAVGVALGLVGLIGLALWWRRR